METMNLSTEFYCHLQQTVILKAISFDHIINSLTHAIVTSYRPLRMRNMPLLHILFFLRGGMNIPPLV
jgi:hypothetical protein